MFLSIVDPLVFTISRIVLFFVAAYFIFQSLKAIDLQKIFKPNSTDQIRIFYLIFSVVFGYLFVEAVIGMLEKVDALF